MDFILLWLLILDILLRLILWYLDTKKPQPLTALYYDFTRITIKEIEELINISDDKQRKQRFEERLRERDYNDRKNGKDGNKKR